MDPSTRLAFLMGTLKLRTEDITLDEWAKLIDIILDELKPHLKYLDGFKIINEFLETHLGEGYYRKVGQILYEWPQGMKGDTRCLVVAEYDKVVTSGKYTILKTLCLLKNGAWLDHRLHYRTTREDGIGSRGDRTITLEIVEESQIFVINETREMLSRIGPSGCEQILRGLDAILDKTIEKKDDVLLSLRAKKTAIQAILGRISL